MFFFRHLYYKEEQCVLLVDCSDIVSEQKEQHEKYELLSYKPLDSSVAWGEFVTTRHLQPTHSDSTIT